ncbi:N-6 DNA methylase [Luteimonas changyuni]|uniref:N-6 DNA methylase n=1 Tax=Luteimonas sp. MJ145 TaxID=3129234 RepID=UPI0031BA5869
MLTNRVEQPPYGLIAQGSFAKPQPGRSLGGAILAAQKPFRAGVAALIESADVKCVSVNSIFDCTVLGPGATVEATHIRLAWLLVNVSFIHAALEQRKHLSPITESAEWFFRSREHVQKALATFSPFSIRAADEALASVKIDQELWDLYPYVIEPQGHVSRSCLQREDARNIRKSKKADGVYYTPSDVADFMVAQLVGEPEIRGAWIDPACGSGVFLRSIITHAKSSRAYAATRGVDLILEHVYGIDKSALATDACAFVMLAELGLNDFHVISPFELWKRLKQNVACMDALNISPNKSAGDLFSEQGGTRSLSSLFPRSATNSIRYLVMNPPYAVSNNQNSVRGAWIALEGGGGKKADLHLAFTEMMWRLDSIESAAAVLPLSIATNTTRIYTKVRNAFVGSSGRKEMLFFDREPQALFGEDIKTRNAIFFRFVSDTNSLHTSQLLKWTAPQRASIFNRERLAPVQSRLCRTLIPKLGTPNEAFAYDQVRSRNLDPVTKYATTLSRRTLAQLVHGHKEDRASISIGGTGYNFLNVFFSSELANYVLDSERLSSSPTIFLTFPDEELALAAYALLSSRLAFWMWRVEGDGFHVTSDFIKKLPFWSVLEDRSLLRELAENGKDIRDASSSSIARSLNGGKETYSFHCGFDRASSQRAEEIALTRLLGETTFSSELDRIIHVVTSIDGKKRRNHHMKLGLEL